MTCNNKHCSWEFVLKASLFVLCIQWQSFRASAVPCYHFFTSKPQPCFPQPVNAARGRNITASNTCGTPASGYCEISPEKTCFVCDANSSLNMHPVEYMIDEESPLASQPTWWQSDTWWDAIQSGISKIGEALHVNITLKFGKSYHVSGKIRVTFYSERPQAMVIERSHDGGVTWNVYQYFAKDCEATYGMSASESPPAENPLEVTCSEDYSRQFPAKNGIVEFQAYTRYQPEDYMAPHIQSYMLATDVRIRLQYPGTDGLEQINSEVTLNRYYYAISDIRIDGRCNCNGHAEFCDGEGMDQYCFCEHHTMGRDCENCRAMYNNQPWKAANTTHANECEKCDCNEHASSCFYDAGVGSGVCIDCTHNTSRMLCNECADGFYRDVSKPLDDLNVCLPCDCFSVGITDNGYCNKNMTRTDIALGQCNCKDNVFGRQCDECVPGYWGFRLPPGGHCQACNCNVFGTLNNSRTCDQQTGNCACKPNIEGEKCNGCKDGFYLFPTQLDADCLTCPCDVGGAYETCEKQTGQCNCRPNIEGEHCTRPKPGHFVPLFDYLLFEAEFESGNNVEYGKRGEHDPFTGHGFAVLTPNMTIYFTNIKVEVSWRYYVVVRLGQSPQDSNVAFNIKIESSNTTITLSSSQGRLEVDEKAVVTNETFSLIANQLYNISVTSSSDSGNAEYSVLVDSLVLKPELASTRIRDKIDTLETLSSCFVNASYVSNEADSKCSDVVFSFNAEMYEGALACDCDPDGSRDTVSCSPIGGQCSCNAGVAARKCTYCLPGYHSFGDGDCKVCECDSAGSETNVCDLTSGLCQCKPNTEGERCGTCKMGTFNLDVKNEEGCQSCFGYGHGVACTSARGFVATNISTDFTDSTLGGWLSRSDSVGALINPGTDGLSLQGNVTLFAPSKYLGAQLNSYKQKLFVTTATPMNSSTTAMYLSLNGLGYHALLQPEISTSHGNQYAAIFTLDEDHLTADSSSLTAFQFQSLLSNVTELRVKVYSELVIKDIVLESAVYEPTSDPQSHITFVENTTCFDNYTGLSCEACAPGFTRENANSDPFSRCVLCSCNGRSSQCDPESGVCIGCDIGSTGDHCESCEFNVIGPYCNVCADGFYGLTQDHKNCKPCDCHLPGTLHGNTSSCNLTTGQCKCNESLHAGGRRCNVCQENAWNRTESSLTCEECPPCFGMIKVEVDKFRQQIYNLRDELRSLLEMDLLSHALTFTERLKITQERVEEIVTRSQALAADEESARQQLERSFDILDVFNKSALKTASEVNQTVNATNRVLQQHRETVRVMEEIKNLITESHDILNNTVGSLMDEIRTSLMLLEDWVTELNEVKANSMDKVSEIGLINKTINDHLQTMVTLVSKAKENATEAVKLFDSLALIVPSLQANITALKENGKDAYDTARQRYNNASIVFNVTSQLEMRMSNSSSSVAEEAIKLRELAQEVEQNASSVIEAVQKASEECSKIVGQITSALKEISLLQEQVRLSERNASERYSESRKSHADATRVVQQAKQTHQHSRNILETMQNYAVVAEQAELKSQKSLNYSSELTRLHQSGIEFAANVTRALQSSYNSSRDLMEVGENVKTHASEENEAISKTFALSEKLRNDTADEKAATVVRNHNIVLDHVENEVKPLHEKCSSLREDVQWTLRNTTQTRDAAASLLVKIEGVSKEVDKTSDDHHALPTLNTRPLAGMVSDITRIRNAFEALKLSSSIEKLRQGKDEQQRWLDEHKPRVLKLRQQVAALQSLIPSLEDIPCNK